MRHVSAVMITGMNAQRQRLAKAAAISFLAQTHLSKDLVIINDSYGRPFQYSVLDDLCEAGRCSGQSLCTVKDYEGCYADTQDGTRIAEYMFELQPTLGHLRNLGLEIAQGDYVMQLDDDDWHHPERMAYQLEHAVRDHCVLLTQQVRYNMLRDMAFVFTNAKDGIAGTILHPRTEHRYPLQLKGEDSVFFQRAFPGKVVKINNRVFPHVYLRFFHETNTWAEGHVMKGYAGRSYEWRPEGQKDGLPKAAKQYLMSVLTQHYGIAAAPTLG